jgi:ABC-2 type transport system ATP-binding protein
VDEFLAIEAQALTRTFGPFVAVDHIDLEVHRGEIFGFLGPNGSGKTTTIRMLTGLMPPSDGTASVLGIDVERDPEDVKRRIGYMSQRFSLYDDLTVDENIELLGALYGVKGGRLRQRRDYVLEMAGLTDRARTVAGTLAGGWKQRLALGCALIHEPSLVFLDEPTGGVDPVGRRLFWDILYELAEEGTTVFVTTHFMDEAEYCNRVSVMLDGEIIAVGPPSELKASMREKMWRLTGAPIDRLYRDVALRVSGCADAVVAGHSVIMRCDAETDVAGQIRDLAKGASLLDVLVVPVHPTMEDVFMSLIGARRD